MVHTSHLSKRSATVQIDPTLSDALPLASGIPQGIERLYVNDLPTVHKTCSSDLYVDDTKLYFSFGVHDCKNAVSAKNEDLLRFRDCLLDNRLLINPEGTKLILYRSRKMTERLPQFYLSLLG